MAVDSRCTQQTMRSLGFLIPSAISSLTVQVGGKYAPVRQYEQTLLSGSGLS
jgi:hypothetical protein